MADVGPPVGLIAFGLILWLAVNATVAGISIQTIGLVLFVCGVAWLILELVQSGSLNRHRRTAVVREEPVVRERDVY